MLIKGINTSGNAKELIPNIGSVTTTPRNPRHFFLGTVPSLLCMAHLGTDLTIQKYHLETNPFSKNPQTFPCTANPLLECKSLNTRQLLLSIPNILHNLFCTMRPPDHRFVYLVTRMGWVDCWDAELKYVEMSGRGLLQLAVRRANSKQQVKFRGKKQ